MANQSQKETPEAARARAAAESRIRFDGLDHSFLRDMLEFATIVIIIFVGISVIGPLANITITIGNFSIGHTGAVPTGWQSILIYAGVLCVGFGVAALFYGKLRAKQSKALYEQFSAIRRRADLLVAKFDDFERGKSAP